MSYLNQHPEPRRLDVARMILEEASEYRDDVVEEAADYVLRSSRSSSQERWAAEAALVDLRVADAFAPVLASLRPSR